MSAVRHGLMKKKHENALSGTEAGTCEMQCQVSFNLLCGQQMNWRGYRCHRGRNTLQARPKKSNGRRKMKEVCSVHVKDEIEEEKDAMDRNKSWSMATLFGIDGICGIHGMSIKIVVPQNLKYSFCVQVTDEIEERLTQWKQEYAQIGAQGAQDAIDDLQGGGGLDALTRAAQLVPELTERKRLLDQHTSICTVLLEKIKERVSARK